MGIDVHPTQLCEAAANVNAVMAQGKTPLHVAIQQSGIPSEMPIECLQACYPSTRAANLEMKDSIWTSNPQLKFCDSWLEKWKVKLFRSSGAQNGMNL